MPSYSAMIPELLGALPLNGVLRRTEPGGPSTARVGFLGIYPAVTELGRWEHEGETYQLPLAVEKTSFESSSSSGREIDAQYLTPLEISRDAVMFFDIMPYYLANTSVSGEDNRSMWSNVDL